MVAEGGAVAGNEVELLSRVEEALEAYEPLRASGSSVDLEARDGVVTLRGRVRTLPLKAVAGKRASEVRGVRQVDNQLVADPELVWRVATALRDNPRTAGSIITVDVRLGVVHLGGKVQDAETQQAALAVARAVESVVGVLSEMVVGTTAAETS